MKMKRRFYIVLLLLCLGTTTQIFAQQKEDVSMETDLNPIVITGTGTKQYLKSTIAPVKVINAKEIEKTGVTETQKVLEQLLPSFSFSPNSMGSYLTMNGLSNKYVLILVNGRRLNGDLSGNVDLQRINPSNIEHIEVLSGAASSLYGSDAIGGVINIITKNTTSPLSVETNTKYDTYKAFTQQANVDFNTKKFSSHTGFQYDMSKGWQQTKLAYTDPETLETEPTLIQTGKAFSSNVFNQKFTYTPSDKLTIYADGQYYTHKTDRPVYSKDIAGGSKYNLEKSAFNAGLGAVYQLNEKVSLSIDAFADQYVQDKNYLVKYKDNKPGDKLRYKEQALYDIRAKSVIQFNEKSQSVFGMEYRMVDEKRPTALLDKSLYNMSVFAQHEQKLGKSLKAIGGLSFDYYENGKWHFSPKAALMYTGNHINLRANYANGFRAANLKEMYYFFATRRSLTLGDENLKPEESHYFSLNGEYHTDRFSISVTPFMNYISNMINVKTTPFSKLDSTYAAQLKAEAARQFDLTDAELSKIRNLREYKNINEARIKGIESSFQAFLGHGTRLYANYVYTIAEGLSKDNEWVDLERSIRHTLTYGANYSRNIGIYHLNFNINARTQSKRYHPGDEYGDAPGYTVFNIMSTHTIRTNKKFILSLSLGVNNLFDKVDDRPYGVNYGLYSPGRTFVFGLNMKI